MVQSLEFVGCRFDGSEFMARYLMVHGPGFRVRMFRMYDPPLGARHHLSLPLSHSLSFSLSLSPPLSLSFRISPRSTGCNFLGTGFRIQGPESKIQGLEFRV